MRRLSRNALRLAFVCLLLVSGLFGTGCVLEKPTSTVLDSFMSFDNASNGVSFKPNSVQDVPFPDTIELFYDKVGLVLVAEYLNGTRIRLPYHFDIGYDFDGEVHWEQNTNRYAVALFDLTGDGVDEVVFAVVAPDGEALSQAEVNVLQFHPPMKGGDMSDPQNWELLSSLQAEGIVGAVNIELKRGAITIPKNYNGLYFKLGFGSSD